jgi:amino acid adenylation domain-containing protein
MSEILTQIPPVIRSTAAVVGRAKVRPDLVVRLRAMASDIGCAANDVIAAVFGALIWRLAWNSTSELRVLCSGHRSDVNLNILAEDSILDVISSLERQGGSANAPTFTLTGVSDFADVIGSIRFTAESAEGEFSLDLSGPCRLRAGEVEDLFAWFAEQCVRCPRAAIAGFDLLCPAERTRLRQFNEGAVAYPRNASLIDLFDEIAAAHGGNSAVETDAGVLSYAELAARSSVISHALYDRGVRCGMRVGVAVADLADFTTIAVAILRCGAAYVPLDAAQPPERRELIVADATLAAIVTDGIITFTGNTPMIAINHLRTGNPTLVRRPARKASDVAYLMYTSGSSGKPKGIAIIDRGIVRLVRQTNYIEFSAKRRVARMASLAFDASTFEIWGALLNGGTVVDVGRPVMTPTALRMVLERRKIDTAFVTTALFHQVTKLLPEAFASLDTLLVGGEQMAPDAYLEVLRCGAPRRIANIYGPTENTTFSSFYLLPGPNHGDARLVPIGRPIAHTRIYVVNRLGQLLPSGIVGEIVISGDGLALGYHGQPELTGRKFRQLVTAAGRTERCYFSGDLGYFNENGDLVCIGRNDAQVKIRGFRIELEDVEHAIEQYRGVKQAGVIAIAPPRQPRHLVAFVAPLPGQVVEAAPLLSFLRGHVPDYMVPSAVRLLPNVLLNTNGKIDRRALRDSYENTLPTTSV